MVIIAFTRQWIHYPNQRISPDPPYTLAAPKLYAKTMFKAV